MTTNADLRTASILAMLTQHTREHVRMLLAAHPSLVITSGRRDAAHNRRVGGVPNSWHLRGRGVDFDHPSSVYLARAADTARRQRTGPRCTGPEEVLHEHVGRKGEHLHVAW